MAGFQAEMDSALVSRLTQLDQKLMKSKEIEEKKVQSDLGDWDWNWRSWKTKEALDEKRFHFSRLTPMADGSKCVFCLDERIKSSHILIFLYREKNATNTNIPADQHPWKCFTNCTSNSTQSTMWNSSRTSAALLPEKIQTESFRKWLSGKWATWNGGSKLYILPWLWWPHLWPTEKKKMNPVWSSSMRYH